MKNRLVIACLIGLLSFSAQKTFAAAPPVIRESVAVCDPNAPTNCLAPTSSGGSPVTTTPAASSITGTTSAKTITNTSTQALAAASRKLLAIDNESATATIACAFGAVAVINTAGSFTILPGFTRTWKSYPVPADAVNCISSVASSPATFEVN